MAAERVELKRRFGLLYAVAIAVNFMIGTGIYIAPSGVMRSVSSPGVALVMWVVSGLVNLCGALMAAELGTTYPTTGCRYDYLRIFYGDFVAFCHVWEYTFITRPAAGMIKCLIIAQYMTRLFFPHCETPMVAIHLIAVCIAAISTFINCINVQCSGKLQNVCACAAIFVLLLISGAGLIYLQTDESHLRSSSIDYFSSGSDYNLADIAIAFYSIFFAYSGWWALNCVVEEINDPSRTLPQAVVISTVLVIVLYFFVNVTYIEVIGVDKIRTTETVVLDVAEKLIGPYSVIVVILIALNTSGSLNSGIMCGSRLCFASAREGQLPDVLSFLSLKSFAPVTSLILQFLGMLCMTFVGDVYTLLNFFSLLERLVDSTVAYGLIYRRYKEPELHRPLKVPIAITMIYAVVCSVLVLGPLLTKPRETGVGLAVVICTATPYYLIFVAGGAVTQQYFVKFKRRFNSTVQKVLVCSAPIKDLTHQS